MSNNIKITIVGNSSVGKTSLVQKMVHNHFKEHSNSTIGAAYLTFLYEKDRESYKFQIWDTAGQERFKSLVPMYLRGSMIVLLVFDITSRNSYEDAIDGWFKTLNEHSPDAIKIFIGSKSDLKHLRAVGIKEAGDFAAKHQMDYIECSSKKNINIDMIKEILIKKTLDMFELKEEITNQPLDSIVISEHPNIFNRFKTSCIGGYFFAENN